MTKEEKIYKVYQLVHFFACKYGYRSFLIKNLAKPDEIWLINQRNSLYNIIRVSNYSLDDTYNDDNRIKQYIQMMSSALKGVKPSFIDIHISDETVTQLEKFDTVCIDSNYYDGTDINGAFPGIRNVVHDVPNAANEISYLIADINESMKKSKSNKYRAKILNSPNLSVTNILIGICAVVYLIGMALQLFTGHDYLYSWLANYRPYVVYFHQFWRLLSYGFVHGSIFHLLMNMYALYIMGNLAERKYGSLKFLIIMLVSILWGGLAHCAFAPKAVSVGISGGIYALFTIYIIDAVKNGAYRDSGFVMMVLINLLLNFMPNVAWQAHLGGLVSGFVFYMMFDEYKLNKSYIFVILIVIIALSVKMLIL